MMKTYAIITVDGIEMWVRRIDGCILSMQSDGWNQWPQLVERGTLRVVNSKTGGWGIHTDLYLADMTQISA